jgi:hypothetical protein
MEYSIMSSNINAAKLRISELIYIEIINEIMKHFALIKG